MTGIVVFIVVTLITSLYAFAISALAEDRPEVAGLIALVVVMMWFVVGKIYFF
jgi:Na+-transporting NADH:ubiquinone oxidoreductase subunit NqrD